MNGSPADGAVTSGSPAITGSRSEVRDGAAPSPGRPTRTAPGTNGTAPGAHAAGNSAPVTGVAAARAALAARQPGGKGAAPAGTRAAGPSAPPAAWADGSPTGEAPYDPEYDGPPRSGAALEGFDPGDEPLDDVVDERTARQSSEQQALQLLRDAFGAEKIGES